MTPPYSSELYILEIKLSELIALHCNSGLRKKNPLETLSIEYKLKFNAFFVGVEELVQALNYLEWKLLLSVADHYAGCLS